MMEPFASFLRLRRLLVLLLSLLAATRVGASALAERKNFGHSSFAAKTAPLKYHCTTAPESSFQKKGLWPQSSITDKLYTNPLEACQKLGIPQYPIK